MADPRMKVHIRWMIDRDMPEVMAIENASFAEPWTEQEFRATLRKRNCIGMVAEYGDCEHEYVAGFMVYQLNRGYLRLLDMAVAPDFRNTGVGSQLVAKLVGKLSPEKQTRTRITLRVSEGSLAAQLFFRSLGFLATDVERDYFDGADAYLMEYDVAAVPGGVPCP